MTTPKIPSPSWREVLKVAEKGRRMGTFRPGTKAEQEMFEELERQDGKDGRVPAKYLAALVFVYALAAVLILYGHTH